MIIRVRGYYAYKALIGQREIEQPDDPAVKLGAFLCLLAKQVGGEFGQVLLDQLSGSGDRRVIVMLNGRHVNHLPDKLDTLLRDQDEVVLFPPAAGG